MLPDSNSLYAKIGRNHRATDAFLAVSVATILWICVRPVGGMDFTGIRTCLICGVEGVPNILLNIVLYVPLGFFVQMRTGRLRAAVLVGFFLSLGVEVAQIWIPGRFTGFVDLGSNTLGALLGGTLAARLWHILRPGDALRVRMLALWSVLVSAVCLLPGALLAPSIPDGAWHVGWTPRLGGYHHYDGRVLSATLGSIELPGGRLTEREAVRQRLLEDELSLRFIIGPTPAGVAPLLHMPARDQTDALMVAVDGEALVVRPRLRARDLALAAPELRIEGALSGMIRGDTVSLGVRIGGASAVRVRIADREEAPSWSSARGWSLLRYPSEWATWALTLLDGIWVFLWIAPLGLWAPSLPFATACALLPISASVLVSIWTPLAAPGMFHAAVTVLALFAGFAAARWPMREPRIQDETQS